MTDESIPDCLRPYKDVLKHPYKDCNDYPERPYRDISFSVNRRCYHLDRGEHHATLLAFAIFRRPKMPDELIKTLIEFPTTNINMGASYGTTPLILACEYGFAHIVAILLRHPAINVN